MKYVAVDVDVDVVAVDVDVDVDADADAVDVVDVVDVEVDAKAKVDELVEYGLAPTYGTVIPIAWVHSYKRIDNWLHGSLDLMVLHYHYVWI